MNSVIDRRITMFEERCQNNSLENYFGIINNKNCKLKITHNRRKRDKIILNINFKKQSYYDFIKLPKELNHNISEYLDEFIFFRVEINYPTDYPFSPPVYNLLNILHNISIDSINLDEYYQYIIDNHNSQYKRDWSPAITVETDILDFIQKINSFEYLLNLC
jgi:hypothetical protein